jgi:hypothetical protein
VEEAVVHQGEQSIGSLSKVCSFTGLKNYIFHAVFFYKYIMQDLLARQLKTGVQLWCMSVSC